MWLMKTLLTSGCTNQRGAGHLRKTRNSTTFIIEEAFQGDSTSLMESMMMANNMLKHIFISAALYLLLISVGVWIGIMYVSYYLCRF